MSSNRNVAHAWANQTGKDQNGSHFYYRGATIFSYSAHFPIGIHVYKGGTMYTIFTNDTYSVSTAKHINYAHSACHNKIIYCSDLPHHIEEIKDVTEVEKSFRHSKNFLYWENQLKDSFQKLLKARKKEIHINHIQAIKESVNQYMWFFNLTENTPELQPLMDAVDSDDFIKYAKAEKERIAKYQAKLLADTKKKLKKQLVEFYAFERKDISLRIDRDFVRLHKTTMRFQTSQGIDIPFAVAQKFYKWLLKARVKGCSGDCAQKLLDYQVKEVTKDYFTIGCHRIYFTDIKQFDAILN